MHVMYTFEITTDRQTFEVEAHGFRSATAAADAFLVKGERIDCIRRLVAQKVVPILRVA